MNLKRLLQGRWLGDPLHPSLVHLPLGAWFTSIGLDLLSLLAPGHDLTRSADWANRAALFAALPALASGLADYADIEDEATFDLATTHLALNLAAIGISAAAWKHRSAHPRERRASPRLAAMQITLLATLVATGYLGGRLVFEKGMRVHALEPPPEKLGPPVWKEKLRRLRAA